MEHTIRRRLTAMLTAALSVGLSAGLAIARTAGRIYPH
jgi:hypothetical protein